MAARSEILILDTEALEHFPAVGVAIDHAFTAHIAGGRNFLRRFMQGFKRDHPLPFQVERLLELLHHRQERAEKHEQHHQTKDCFCP